LPEGPEVKRERVFLQSKIEGKVLSRIDVLTGRYTKKPIVGLAELTLPSTVTEVGGKGKLITIKLENGKTILSTLGMSGGWSLHSTLLLEQYAKYKKHERVTLRVDGENDCSYVDMRNFGTLKVVTHDEAKRKIDSLGFDMLTNPPSIEQWLELMEKNKHTPFYELLMNQGKICGVGNIYKSESLYAAQISPHRTPAACSIDELTLLYKAVKECLKFAYETGSATPYTYMIFMRHGMEVPVEHRKELVAGSAVYGRRKDIYGNDVLNDTTTGRTTWWVPSIQK
jgi:formamidopyrimidine-DNA glycosylase